MATSQKRQNSQPNLNSNLDVTRKFEFSSEQQESEIEELPPASEAGSSDYGVESEFMPTIPTPQIIY